MNRGQQFENIFRLLPFKSVDNRDRAFISVFLSDNAEPVVRSMRQIEVDHKHLIRRYRNLLHIITPISK